jgi:hypothetical protein
MWAVILIVTLALLALETRPNLCSNTDTVPNLDAGHLVADLDSMANDLVSNADGKRNFAPAPGNGVNIRGAHPAALDLDIDVVGAELLGFELWRLSAWTRRRGQLSVINKPLAS